MNKKKSASQVLFYSIELNARVQYIAELLFEQVLGLELIYTQNKDEFISSSLAKVHYGNARINEEEFFIPAHTLLFEKKIQAQKVEILESHGLAIFFNLDQSKGDLTFDLLAMSFYLVTRYEEYLPFDADEHGRFCAPKSLAFKEGFLSQAIINLWALKLKILLVAKFPFIKITTTTYQFQPSFDIDMAWAFLHKGFLRTCGAITKDLLKANFGNLVYRFKVLTQQLPDPFFSFDFINEVHQGNIPKPIFFFLLGTHGIYDKNISTKSSDFQQLIQQVSSQYELGIHPSYQSNDHAHWIEKEKNILEKICKKKVFKTRQHFLKLKFPNTYQQLIAANLKQDYSMGYASALGFRASISTPFYWYDLQKEMMTDLLIHPFQLMDVSLKSYLKLDINQAKEAIEKIIESTKESKGTLIPIWHNSSFTSFEDWDDWREVYLHLLKKAE